VATSTKAAKVVNSEREEDNILVDKVLKHLLPRRGSIVVKLLLFSISRAVYDVETRPAEMSVSGFRCRNLFCLLATNDATELTPLFSQAAKSASTFIVSQGKHITMACRALIFLLVIVAAVNAFLPVANNGDGGASKSSSIINTRLEFGFLKELGLEKPSWLPDFGGKKEEDTTNDAPVATVVEGDDAPAAAAAAAAPEDDAAAPKDDDAAPTED
jgi:hypothetical protein